MKAERTMPRTAESPRGQPAWGASTLRGTLLLRMATLGTLAKQRRCHPLKAPCLHLAPQAGCPLPPQRRCAAGDPAWGPRSLAKRYFNCQKTKGAGFKPPREAARSLQFSRFFFWDLGAGGRSRWLLPDVTAIYGRLLSESAAKNIGRWQAQT